MDNQHKQIKGYRDLTQQEIDLMNEGKELAEKCRVFLERVEFHYNGNADRRSLDLAKTNLQQGFMWAVRSIAKPETF